MNIKIKQYGLFEYIAFRSDDDYYDYDTVIGFGKTKCEAVFDLEKTEKVNDHQN